MYRRELVIGVTVAVASSGCFALDSEEPGKSPTDDSGEPETEERPSTEDDRPADDGTEHEVATPSPPGETETGIEDDSDSDGDAEESTDIDVEVTYRGDEVSVEIIRAGGATAVEVDGFDGADPEDLSGTGRDGPWVLGDSEVRIDDPEDGDSFRWRIDAEGTPDSGDEIAFEADVDAEAPVREFYTVP